MFGNNSRLNPLESRKRLLVAESELNRAHLVQEWVAMTAGVRTLARRLKSFGSIASAAGLLVAGLAAFRRGKSGSADVKLSWFQAILKVAGMVSTLWLAFRAKGQDQQNKHKKTSSRDRSNRRSSAPDANHQEQLNKNK
jgi:hypothetical protein